MSEFGDLLRLYRLQCRLPQTGGKLTQEHLAEELSFRSGIGGFSGRTVSNWERGEHKIRQTHRHVVISLLQILREFGGVRTLGEAEALLAAGDYRRLTAVEAKQVNPNWQRPFNTLPDGSPWPTVEEQLALLPPPTYSRLFGLETTVAELERRMLAKRGSSVVMIVGLGGLGKSTLARVVAQRLLAEGSFVRVVWLTLTETEAIWETAVSQLHQQLLPQQSADLPFQHQFVQVRRLLTQHPHLIVLDNLESEAVVQTLLPHLQGISQPSRFLLTARQVPGGDAGNAFLFHMPTLSPEASLDLLRYQAEAVGNGRFLEAPETDLANLSQLVGGHPLALRLLPRLGQVIPLPQLVASWQQSQIWPIEGLYQAIYAGIWEGLTAVEHQLLITLPLISPAGSTVAHLQAISGLAGDALWTAVLALEAACLLSPGGSVYVPRYGVHGLTRQFLLRQWYQTGIPLQAVVANLVYWQQYLQEPPLGQTSRRNREHPIEAEQANICQAMAVSLGLPDDVLTTEMKALWVAIAEQMFLYFEQRGNGRLWIPILALLAEKFPADKQTQCQLLSRLGILYRMQQDFDKAISQHQISLEIAQQLEDEQLVAQAHLDLGNDYYRHQQVEKALAHGQAALQQPGLTRRHTAACFNLLGLAAQEQHKLTLAESYFVRAAALWEELELASEQTRSLNNLGRVLQQQGRYDEAIACFAQAKTMLAKSGSALDRVLLCLSEGTLYFSLNRTAEAHAVFQQIDLQFLERAGHLLYYGLALNNLGNIAFVQGDYVQAEDYLQRSAAIWQEIGYDLELANTLGKLGDVFGMQGMVAAAELAYERTIAITTKYPNDERAIQLQKDTRVDLARLRQ